MEGFFPSPAGGCVTSAPRKITGCWKTAELSKERKQNGEELCLLWLVPSSPHSSLLPLLLQPLCLEVVLVFSSIPSRLPWQKQENGSSYRWCGTRMLLMPPSLTLILRQRLDRVWGEVLTTFFTCTHWVAIPKSVSPTRFTSATSREKTDECMANLLKVY